MSVDVTTLSEKQ